MRIYDKRIGFLVSYQTLIPHGGIGQFTKSFCELMDEHDIKVDIITDKKPQDNDFIKSLKANIIYPNESLSYTKHSLVHMYGDTYCYERMVNFRNAITQAFENNLYDVLICNTYETIQVVSTLGIDNFIQIIPYTHLESQIFKDTKNPFLASTNEMMRLQLHVSNLYIGTQSKFNEIELAGSISTNNVYHLPIPITERGLLEEYHKPREGILFVGRWEKGKNPELFIELIDQTKLPAKVMTSPNGVKKFEERLKKIGVPYDVRASIVGQEKVDFITSARVAFNPSTVESYGMAFYEQMIQLPTFVLKNQRWTQNFNSKYFFTTTKKDMAKDIKKVYDDMPWHWYESGSLAFHKAREQETFHKWNHCFNEFKCYKSNTDSAKICNETTTTVTDFIKCLQRDSICIDDVKSIHGNKHKFRIIYTDSDTYLTKDPSFKPVEEQSGLSLFEGL